MEPQTGCREEMVRYLLGALPDAGRGRLAGGLRRRFARRYLSSAAKRRRVGLMAVLADFHLSPRLGYSITLEVAGQACCSRRRRMDRHGHRAPGAGSLATGGTLRGWNVHDEESAERDHGHHRLAGPHRARVHRRGVGKQLGLAVESVKREDGERRHRVRD